MKNLYLLLATVLAAVLPATVWADTYQDPTSGVVYEYEAWEDSAIVAKGLRMESDVFSQCALYGNTISAEVIIPESFDLGGKTYTVTGIGEYAFCFSEMTSVVIPKTVHKVGQMAFAECSRLSDVFCYANPKTLTWDNTVFAGYKNFKPNGNTKFHVIAGYLDAYITKFKSLNVTFVGDLEGEVDEEVEETSTISLFGGWESRGSVSGIMWDVEGHGWTTEFDRAPDYVGFASLSKYCICIEDYSGDMMHFKVSNMGMFDVTGTVKRVIVSAMGGLFALTGRVQESSGMNSQYAEMTATPGDTFTDHVLEFDGKTTYADAVIWLEFFANSPVFISSITIVTVGEERLPEGKCGPELTYRMEWLPYKITDLETQTMVKAARLTIDGRGEMYDYTASDRPWEQYRKNIAEVILPDEMTHVGAFAFDRLWGVNWTVLPTNLKSVGIYAFYNCMFSNTLRLPEGLTSIGSMGLCALNGVKDLYVPKSLSVIEEAGLTDIMGLENFHVDAANPYFTDEGNSLIQKSTKTLISACKNTVIPNWVTTIGSRAYEDVRVDAVKFPNSITKIGDYAFMRCKIKELSLPDNIQTIGIMAFGQCGQMTKVTIGNGVTSIGQAVFTGSTNIFDVLCYADPDKLNWTETTYEEKSFMPDGVTKFHVKPENLSKWQSKFSFLNVTFAGDLNSYIETILEETTVDVSGLGTADLTDNTVANVYYNLSEATHSGYADGSLVIGRTTDMSAISDANPGSADIRDNFTGIILKVGPGRGTVTIDAQVLGSSTQLAVRIGNGTPVYAAKDSRWNVLVGYDVDVETYVYIYAVGSGALVRPYANRVAPEEGSVLIYGITVTPGEDPDGIDNLTPDTSPKAEESSAIYNLAGQRVSKTEKGLYIINGKKVMVK